MVMEGSASAFMHRASRRNREYPSFSSALLEEISRSTESRATVEDEKINRRRQEMKFSRDSSTGVLPVCKEPRGEGGIEIDIFEALKYFHGHVGNDIDGAAEVDKKKTKKKVPALQSRRGPAEAESTKHFMGRAAAADVLVCRQWQSNVARHGNKDASSSSSSSCSHGGAGAVEQTTRTKQPMSPGRRLANFLNSLFMGMRKRKSKREVDHRSETINGNEKYKYGREKEKAAAAGQFKSVSVCSMSSVTSNCTSTASTTSSYSNSSRLHHYNSNPRNVSKSEHAMKRYENGIRRSVEFYPATTVRFDEYALPCTGKDLNRTVLDNHNKHSLPFPSKHLRRVQSLEKGMIPSSEYLRYHQDRKYSKKLLQTQEEDENCDSDSSSDLFELQNLNAVDINIYSRELPVYETTNLETNRAIAKGLL